MTNWEAFEYVHNRAAAAADQLVTGGIRDDDHARRALLEAYHEFVLAALVLEQCILNDMLRAPAS